MHEPRAQIEWRDDHIPVSTRFDDPYFSLEDGLAETRHVFLSGNHLPERFVNGFQVAELGFGTGLNFLATWQAWREKWGEERPGERFYYTSFEAFPLTNETLEHALGSFTSLGSLRQNLFDQYHPSGGVFSFADVTLELIIGDARQCVPQWHGAADAWFLDGFSPAKNPEMWTEELMEAVAQKTASNGSFATYTAAGFVRRALSKAGFDVSRQKGFGRKRHMSQGFIKHNI